jgi:hypothetical protein
VNGETQCGRPRGVFVSSMSRAHTSLLAILLASVCACAVPQRAAQLPEDRNVAWIAVLSGEMPEAISQVARHAWIVGHLPADRSPSTVHRWEYLGGASRSETDAPFHYFGRGETAVHGIVAGSPDEIAAKMRCLDGEARAFDARHPTYFPIPGPNSNTFVAEALRECGIHVELPATCVGRDYRGPIGAGVTESGTGVQLESWVAGVRIGLREGAEAHVAGLALGVHVWPPGLTVPVNPGRIGIDLDGHVPADPRRSYEAQDRDWDRNFGVGVAQMFASVARVKRPADAGGLAERAVVGLSARGVYTKKHLGYGIGADLQLGAAFPAGFAYGFYLYPAGIAWLIGPTGYVGVFGGFGTSGVSARVTGGLELPVEARAELDVASRLRLGIRGSVAWVPYVDDRRGGSVLPFGDELVLGTFVRFGRTENSIFGSGAAGHGPFLGLERHEVMHTFWLGLTFGVEADFGG